MVQWHFKRQPTTYDTQIPPLVLVLHLRIDLGNHHNTFGVHKWDTLNCGKCHLDLSVVRSTTFYNQIGILNDSLCWKINKSLVQIFIGLNISTVHDHWRYVTWTDTADPYKHYTMVSFNHVILISSSMPGGGGLFVIIQPKMPNCISSWFGQFLGMNYYLCLIFTNVPYDVIMHLPIRFVCLVYR